jgi:hypothetical protein
MYERLAQSSPDGRGRSWSSHFFSYFSPSDTGLMPPTAFGPAVSPRRAQTRRGPRRCSPTAATEVGPTEMIVVAVPLVSAVYLSCRDVKIARRTWRPGSTCRQPPMGAVHREWGRLRP